MLTHTEAIVFRTVDYQESSKIITLFTREHGKIGVLVRGVKKPKSKFSGLIEPGNLLDVVYYYKSSRSVQILSEASFLSKTLNIRTDVEKMALSLSAVELISQVLHDEEVNEPIFELSRNFIEWLDHTEQKPKNIFPYLQIRLAEHTGHGLGLHIDGGATKEDETFYLNLDSGLISTRSDSSYSYPLTQNQFRYVHCALKAQSSALLDIEFETGELKQLIDYLDRYFKFHIEGFKKRKSDAIFEQMLQD